MIELHAYLSLFFIITFLTVGLCLTELSWYFQQPEILAKIAAQFVWMMLNAWTAAISSEPSRHYRIWPLTCSPPTTLSSFTVATTWLLILPWVVCVCANLRPVAQRAPSPESPFPSLNVSLKFFLFIYFWLCQVLVVALKIFDALLRIFFLVVHNSPIVVHALQSTWALDFGLVALCYVRS